MSQLNILLRRPNPFAFPGTQPGFDPAHPASQGIRNSGASAIACPVGGNLGGMYNLVNPGPPGSIALWNGVVSAANVGILGPVIRIARGGPNGLYFPNISLPASAPTGSWTFANIIQLDTIVGGAYQQMSDMGGTGFAATSTATQALTVVIAGTNVTATNLVPQAGVPYFVAASWQIGSFINFVMTNLNTGQVQTQQVATAHAYNAAGTVFISTASTGTTLGGVIAALMFSYTPNVLTLNQLANWGQDPWSFWYPQKFDIGQMIRNPVAPPLPILNFDTPIIHRVPTSPFDLSVALNPNIFKNNVPLFNGDQSSSKVIPHFQPLTPFPLNPNTNTNPFPFNNMSQWVVQSTNPSTGKSYYDVPYNLLLSQAPGLIMGQIWT